MKTQHRTIFSDSRQMPELSNESVDLIITSPPYPMIEMWDTLFSQQNPAIKTQLEKQNGPVAFELMHAVLDATWRECYRVLKPGGFACINIGDATRTLNQNFALYTNHARILTIALKIGFSPLPSILWRKQTNAPNKYMGSGMLPAAAYVTLEHEYILILRKGKKREFKTDSEKKNRRSSAMFWEERNLWFSDIWFDIKGSSQILNNEAARKRSAAYPFELACRLINMFSVKNDLILDPFLGLGTTALAAMACARNCMGYEIEPLIDLATLQPENALIEAGKNYIQHRLNRHHDFVQQRTRAKGPLKHTNMHYGFPVMTAQEKELLFNKPFAIQPLEDHILMVDYTSNTDLKDWQLNNQD